MKFRIEKYTQEVDHNLDDLFPPSLIPTVNVYHHEGYYYGGGQLDPPEYDDNRYIFEFSFWRWALVLIDYPSRRQERRKYGGGW